MDVYTCFGATNKKENRSNTTLHSCTYTRTHHIAVDAARALAQLVKRVRVLGYHSDPEGCCQYQRPEQCDDGANHLFCETMP